MKNFIFEIYSEELPARMQKNAEQDFATIFTSFFKDFEIEAKEIIPYVGPCRLAITALIAEEIESKSIEIRGPKLDAPQAAVEGFCRSNNLKIQDLSIKKIKDVDFYFAEIKTEKHKTKNIIESEINNYLSKIIWPKSMVWGVCNSSWVRPVKNILCLLDQEIIPLKFLHLEANNQSFGHKFMCNVPIVITDNYVNLLRNAKVISLREERKKIIETGFNNICTKLGVTLNKDDKLLEEVAGLSEFPVALYGHIDSKFMSLPPEILVTSMRIHQKYFTVNTKNQELAPYFLFITNLDLSDYSEIIEGNQKVLSARLNDALFFYNSDIEKNLETNISKLHNIVFHTKLGSLFNKTERIVKLTKFIDNEDINAIKAAKLCKCDLVTEIIYEFPELQGVMGSHYAKMQGFSTEISDAIRNHYKPISAEDIPPYGSAAIVSIADKIDSLVALFLAGERATSSKDPYGLRRYAIGIIKTILANNLQLDISKLIEYSTSLVELQSTPKDLEEILSFIEERFKFFLKSEYAIEIINSVVDLKKNSNLLSNSLIIASIDRAFKKREGIALISLYKRMKNIVLEDKKFMPINISLLKTASEKHLYNKIIDISGLIKESLEKQDFDRAIDLLLTFEQPLSKFFEENLVNSDELDIANNRKSLLFEASQLFTEIVKFDEF